MASGALHSHRLLIAFRGREEAKENGKKIHKRDSPGLKYTKCVGFQGSALPKTLSCIKGEEKRGNKGHKKVTEEEKWVGRRDGGGRKVKSRGGRDPTKFGNKSTPMSTIASLR